MQKNKLLLIGLAILFLSGVMYIQRFSKVQDPTVFLSHVADGVNILDVRSEGQDQNGNLIRKLGQQMYPSSRLKINDKGITHQIICYGYAVKSEIKQFDRANLEQLFSDRLRQIGGKKKESYKWDLGGTDLIIYYQSDNPNVPGWEIPDGYITAKVCYGDIAYDDTKPGWQ